MFLIQAGLCDKYSYEFICSHVKKRYLMCPGAEGGEFFIYSFFKLFFISLFSFL